MQMLDHPGIGSSNSDREMDFASSIEALIHNLIHRFWREKLCPVGEDVAIYNASPLFSQFASHRHCIWSY